MIVACVEASCIPALSSVPSVARKELYEVSCKLFMSTRNGSWVNKARYFSRCQNNNNALSLAKCKQLTVLHLHISFSIIIKSEITASSLVYIIALTSPKIDLPDNQQRGIFRNALQQLQ